MQVGDRNKMDSKMNKEFKDVPLSESNVSLKLADIQKRCLLMRRKTDVIEGLVLEESVHKPENDDPYSHG